jgi:hypothetical protein
MTWDTSLTLPTGHFNLKLWRTFLREVAEGIGPHTEVICPFGFEVSENRAFLKERIRNFFLYFGIPADSTVPSQGWFSEFTEVFLYVLNRTFPILSASINTINGMGVSRQNASGGDVFIYTKFRTRNIPLLDEYSEFLLASIGGISNRQIKAIRKFPVDPMSRRYLFQLTMIHEFIFHTGRLGPDENERLKNAIRALHGSEAMKLSRNGSFPNIEEERLKEEVVLPYFAYLTRLVGTLQNNEDEVVSLVVKDFHGDKDLTVNMSRAALSAKKSEIIRSYREFEII